MLAVIAAPAAMLAFWKNASELLPESWRGHVPYAAAALLILAFVLIVRALLFAVPRRSVLVRPDASILRRDDREHLVGRRDDIDRLVEQLRTSPLVFLEGESGVGKSALLAAGVVPHLASKRVSSLTAEALKQASSRSRISQRMRTSVDPSFAFRMSPKLVDGGGPGRR